MNTHLFRTVAATISTLAITCTAQIARAAAGDLYPSGDGTTVTRITPSGTKSTFATGVNFAGGLGFDPSGNLFIIGYADDQIFKITPSGTKTVFANDPDAINLAVNASGEVFVAENNGIAKYSPAGVKSSFATGLLNPQGLAFDHAGNLFVTNVGTGTITKITATGTKTTFASGLNKPSSLAFDGAGNLFVSVGGANQVVRYTPAGTGTIFATGFTAVEGVAVDAAGTVYVGDNTSAGPVIYKCLSSGKAIFASNLASARFLAFEGARAFPLNISTRLRVQTGDNVLIGGFIITGTAGKKVIIRAIGPSLGAAGITDALQDPILQLYNSAGGFVNGNDNWKDSNAAAIQATGVAPSDDRESALVLTLGVDSYTAVIRGKSNTTGVALVEVYDLDQAANSHLANISSRGFVESGNNVMIGGFIIGGGNGAGKVIVRGLGPSLAQAGIANPLPDPGLRLFDGNGNQIAFNDDWKSSASNQAEVQNTGVPPTNDLESAIVATLPNGNYTAVVRDLQNRPGVGLVEIYHLQ
jgi:sugar lactone lactonase YvrE